MKKIKNQVQKYKMLSEHTLEDYLKWYKNDFSKKNNIHGDGRSIFYMPFEFGIGVIIKFAESRGFKISITYSEKFNYWNYYVSHCEFGSTNETAIKSFKKIAKLALEEFDKRYNNTWNAM